MASEPEAKRPRTGDEAGARSAALGRLKGEVGDCRTHEFTAEGWVAGPGGEQDVCHSKVQELDFGGDGRLFRVRLARHSKAALAAAEESGDFDLAPFEVQLMAEGPAEAPGQLAAARWPPQFRLFAYECMRAAGRAPSGGFEELLDTSKVRFARSPQGQRGSCGIAFVLPGVGASCEVVGVSHELLQQSIDEMRRSCSPMHLVLAVPLPEKQLAGAYQSETSIRMAEEAEEEESSDEDSSDEDAGE